MLLRYDFLLLPRLLNVLIALTYISGAMVLLPVPIDGTTTHVANTLPSDANMTIIVSSAAEKRTLVCLPKVLRALRWLKANNVHYANVR